MVIGDLLGFVHLIIPSARGSKMATVAFKLADFFLSHGDGKIIRSLWIEMEEVQ